MDHANIRTIYEIDETDDGQMFIAMGYYAGESLAELMHQTKLTREGAVAGTASYMSPEQAQGHVERPAG